MLNDNEYTEFENRKYLNPQIMVDESNAFIDNLRNTQQANNQQIRNQTYNLGTQVSSNLGGLAGGGSYFTSRYQTPQTNSAVANLRATAQASALNQALANEQEVWKKRYNDAYRKYQKSAYDKSNSGGNTGGNNGTNPDDGEVEVITTPSSYSYDSALRGTEGYYTVVSPDGKLHAVDMITGEEIVVDPLATNSGLMYGFSGGGSGGGAGGGW